MSIEFRKGDVLAVQADATVVTVNCVGVMGKGVAKAAKLKYPEVWYDYRAACADGRLRPGNVIRVFNVDGRDFLLAATKDHWRMPSELAWIDCAISQIRFLADVANFKTVALPPLGCGNGGLRREDVDPLMIAAFEQHSCRFIVCV